ncbi:phosphoglucosamine mutase [Marinibaculum pumilum]|uniref:Phosphoglucosamine mutase n=1 Tax=Marinibaculum pumilum TaxID=1766165 RepID=A0ABV7L6R2_9PROT
MAGKLFGTDGVRGLANAEPMTPHTALRLGMAAGRHFRRGDYRHRVLIGKDTRLSGYMIEPALTAGFVSVGLDAILLGPMPTPAVAMLTRSMRADLGVMISASHNPFHDNGIKLFGPDGYKLSDAVEAQIAADMDEVLQVGERPTGAELGRAQRLEDARGRYIEFVKQTLPRGFRLDGLRVVLDCANGAAYRVAPTVLFELGAEVIPLGVEPNGLNINDNCGSTRPERMQEEVVASGADLGIALDGDADRLVLADEKGRLVDGDQLIAAITRIWHAQGRLAGPVVATVMSNLGLERFVRGLGLDFQRTSVGDRYVLERMRESGANLGGEQSGHIILSDYATTGDGLIAALQVMALIAEADQPASAVCHQFDALPQITRSVRLNGGKPLEQDAVKAEIAAAQDRLGPDGQLLIRPSGTEPVIRIMAQGEDAQAVEAVVAGLADAIAAAA